MRLPKAFAKLSKGSKSGLSSIAFAGYAAAVAVLGLTAMFADDDQGRRKASSDSVLTGSISLSTKKYTAKLEQSKTFEEFIDALKQYAEHKGFAPDLLARLFKDMKIDDEVIGFTTSQPEHVRAPWDYIGSLVSDKRIVDGQDMLQKHALELAKIESAYGVERQVLIAIWGIESSYGSGQGERKILRSLATLSYQDKRRASFWRQQLIAALKIIANGDIASENMTGSWAGAMGHTQFMPTTYLDHAVDFDGDGKRNIWGSISDALASTAAYLKASKWKNGLAWGHEVVLPKGFDYSLSAPGNGQPAKEWLQLGVSAATKPLPTGDGKLKLLLPAGNRGPAFLVSSNFKSILRYNNSTLYALSVGHLADRLARGPKIVGAWPLDLKLLAKEQRIELQRLLNERGLDTGGIDGILGGRSKAAIRSYQSAMSLPADGFASIDLLDRLRGSAQADKTDLANTDLANTEKASNTEQAIKAKLPDKAKDVQ